MSQQPDESPRTPFAGFGKFVPGFDFLQNLVTRRRQQNHGDGSQQWFADAGVGWLDRADHEWEELDRRIKGAWRSNFG
jgi:hypothetical protein